MSKHVRLTVCAFFIALSAWAQDRVVTGQVKDNNGSPLPGVNVVVKGTANGTITDMDGKYSISVPSGATLTFSSIGMKTTEQAVGERSVVDVGMAEDAKQLTEVVVTAQGIEREVKAIGFAQTTISSQLLANKPETDVGRALQGRTPGLQILNSSGLAGSSSRINIRGNSSITGNTQPLWVIDGVPINTDSNDINQDFRDGQVAPSRFLDIDPNNIENISILRGLNATTLYGSQGRNGVILVTTKTGGKKGAVGGFDGSATVSHFAVEAILPQYQNKWANGFDGAYGEFFSNWGSLFNGKGTSFRHPYYEWRNLFPQFPEFATAADAANPDGTSGYIPKAAPNNVRDFFKKGVSSTYSLSLSKRTEFGSVSFSYSHLDEKGFIQNNNLKRDNFSLGGTAKLTERLSFKGVFNYVITDMETPPSGAGQGSNSVGGPSVFANIFYTPRNIDLSAWPYENPNDFSNVYYRNNNSIVNPYWLVKNSRQTNLTKRFFSSSSLTYKIAKDIDVMYRLGYDTYSEYQQYWLNRGGGAGITEAALAPGALRTVNGLSTVVDHSFIATINKKLVKDINFSGIVGFNYRSNKYSQSGLESTGQVIYNLLEHRNFQTTLSSDFRKNPLNFVRNSAIMGAFFDASFDYKSMVFFNVSGRNDWTSTLQKENRSLFYPGVSISFVPTTMFPNLATKALDFLKIRLAYGTSANFGNPYTTSKYLSLNSQTRSDAIGNVVTIRNPSLLANAALKPELLSETELGIEGNFIDNRIKMNLSFYNRKAKNQIIERPLDNATGSYSTYINAGTISNKGIELGLTGSPLRNEDWNLDITLNYTKNVSKVETLPDGSKEILINGYTNLGNFAIEGQPLNVIKGTYVVTAPDGQKIVREDGNYEASTDIRVIADPNPKWLGSAIISLRWKAITFGMQWDYVKGGQTFSYTAQTLIGRGVAKDLESFDPTLPLTLPGVNVVKNDQGTVTGYTPNNIPLTTAGVFFGNSIIGGDVISERGIYDATRVRFREVTLAYNVPKNIAERLKLKGINITFIGNNLWFRALNAPKYARADFDRTAFGTNNGAGFDYMGGPSARRYGVTLKLNF